MNDNATCHRTLAVQDCLESEGIQRLVWPARSPDLNPIENVWDALGRQVAGQNYPPTNKSTLIRSLTKEWYKLPQQLLDNVVQMADYEQLLTFVNLPSTFTESRDLVLVRCHRDGYQSSQIFQEKKSAQSVVNVVPQPVDDAGDQERMVLLPEEEGRGKRGS
ncbi:hypothetical protein TNCV_4688201 [Trichonephila clavipes]|nr:hypothetical protein TNCV_4688201 [Trichonephila clavipes]